jgi:hypothetical protein
VLALSEVAGLLGKPYAPVLPPWGTGLAAAVLRRLGVRIPPEALNQLRYGRGVDNRRFKATGFDYQHTSREAVLKLGEHLRLHPVLCGAQEPYRYEREVEEFLRWSPHVRNARDRKASPLNRDQLAELQRLLSSFAETSGLQELEGQVERVAADEELARAEERAETGERLDAAEQRAEAAERAAQRAIQRAKKAEQRAAEAALKATERAKKAEKRATAAAEEAGRRATEAATQSAAADAERRAAAEAERQTIELAAARRTPVAHYDDLAAEEVIALLASLERDDLQTLRDYERRHANRVSVLSAIDSVLVRGETPV